MLWPKKNSYKEFYYEKKFLRLENSPPPPPHNFSNGPSLKIAASCVNTDFWLDKITRESRYTLDLPHFVQNKFALGR